MKTCNFDAYYAPAEYNNTELYIADWLNGFDQNLQSPILDKVVNFARSQNISKIYTCYVFDERIRRQYADIQFFYKQQLLTGEHWDEFKKFNQHDPLTFQNFVCSFNGSDEIGRRLLVAILKRFNWFDPIFCTKNFSFSIDALDGHIDELSNCPDFHRKFFVSDEINNFYQSINSIEYNKYDHLSNVRSLQSTITKSFLNIVAESELTSYYPIVTEKILHSLVTRGLFLSFAQPGWHKHFAECFGFRNYDKIFDYKFDDIQNPVDRLIQLITMLSKFSVLSKLDWHDLYHMEQESIEYNLDHYRSNDYMNCVNRYENSFLS
jgi:hypothetical protein